MKNVKKSFILILYLILIGGQYTCPASDHQDEQSTPLSGHTSTVPHDGDKRTIPLSETLQGIEVQPETRCYVNVSEFSIDQRRWITAYLSNATQASNPSTWFKIKSNTYRSQFMNIESIPIDTWRQITSYFSYKDKLHHVNRFLFNVVTDYPIADIHYTGITHHLSLNRSCLSQVEGLKLGFIDDQDKNLKRVPNYIWFSMIHGFETRVECSLESLFSISYDTRSAMELAKASKNTRINTVEIVDNSIGQIFRNELCAAYKDIKCLVYNCKSFQENT